LILQMAKDNPTWGYSRIQGALRHLDHRVARSTVAKTMKEHGIEPSPDRPMSWRTFVRSHAHLIAAADFFTTEVWTARGLVTHYTLFVIDIATRRVHIAGTTTHPTSEWMEQIGRNLTEWEDGFLRDASYVILDRERKFLPFRGYSEDNTDIAAVVLPPRSPNLNAYLERFMRSLKSERVDRMILFGQESLERALGEFVEHYHSERNHQGLDNRIIETGEEVGRDDGEVICRERLRGMLRYYYRDAA